MKTKICFFWSAFVVGCFGGPDLCGQTADLTKRSVSVERKVNQYQSVKLTTDLGKLSPNEKKMIPFLIEAARIMDGLFWYEAYGNRAELLQSIQDAATRQFVEMNYGPWDRLDGNQAFVPGVSEKPKGANFYPRDMTKEEFENAVLPEKESLYTLLRRDSRGRLVTVPYRVQFAEQVGAAAALLKNAAALAEAPGLKNYLNLRAQALLTDDYKPSDLAWLDMKDNTLDIVIGPIENYEDALFGYKAAHEAYVLVKDQQWSARLSKYAGFLTELQQSLPVEAQYKTETPGSNGDLNAYDVIYYAGDCNAGSKTIAINLPNDESVQLEKGTRRLQLKNAMRAKFEKILVPIAQVLIAEDQRRHIKFDAFFGNTMFHEIAHGLGIKNTINGRGSVREALREYGGALEEGKADILGLHMITQLHPKGEIDGDLEDYYVTFLAGIFRSVRFGAASAHGKANMIRFNYFRSHQAFSRDDATGTYRVRFDKMREAIESLSRLILTLQGDGAYDRVVSWAQDFGVVRSSLRADLDRLSEANIAVDVVFEQGVDVLGL